MQLGSVPLSLQLVPAVALGLGMVFMPFSPRWLVHYDREAEARKTLASLRNLPQDHELIELEFLEIKAQSLFEKRSIAERLPHMADNSAWSIGKPHFIATGSLFKSMLSRFSFSNERVSGKAARLPFRFTLANV